MVIACITTQLEVSTIGHLVRELLNLGFPTIVVDNYSSDGTAEVAARCGALVFQGFYQLHVGLMTGWRKALEMGADRVIQIDAGGSHLVTDATRLSKASGDLVIGSRFTAGSQYIGRRWRAWASCCFGLLANLAALRAGMNFQWIRDWTSGLRVFSKPLLLDLLDTCYIFGRHVWQAEVLLAALSRGYNIRELPVTYRSGTTSLGLGTYRDAALFLKLLAAGYTPTRLRGGFDA